MNTVANGRGRTRLLQLGVSLVLLLLVALACARGEAAPVVQPSQSSHPTPTAELPVLGKARDFELTNQDGVRVRLSDLRDKVVLMNFVYTSCPGACHLQNFDLLMVRNGLDEASRQGLALLSITFDPEVDTPQVLKEYAAARSFDIPGWHFLTGNPDEIARVTEAYGVVYELVPPSEHVHPGGEVHPHERGFNHMSQAFLIDPQGMGRKSYLGIQMGQQVFAIEEMLADVKSLLPR